MAVRTSPQAPGQPGTRNRPSFELWSWFFMRLSGIMLLFLAVGHVLIMHVVDEGVQRVDFDFVADRWASPFWRTWDWMLLTLALLHGVNGMRVVIMDYVRRPGRRLLWNSVFIIVSFALFVLGTVVVFTFDASQFGL
jgi:succinate dehydrogenase / fumarate reductase, membrane anchor subunit